MLSSYRQPIFGALRDQASDVILTGIPEQQRAKMRGRRISDQPESGKHDEVLQMFSINVDLLTNLPIRPARLQYRKRSFVELPIIVPSPTIGPVSAHHHTGLRSSSRRTFDACKWQRPITRSHPIESRLT